MKKMNLNQAKMTQRKTVASGGVPAMGKISDPTLLAKGGSVKKPKMPMAPATKIKIANGVPGMAAGGKPKKGCM